MLKTFDRYIIRELIPPFLLGLLVYTFVLLMNQIFLLADLLISRGVPFGIGVRILVFLLPGLMAFTLPMSVLMGILAGLSRLSSDSEMVALKTLGVGPGRLVKPVLAFSLAGWLLTLALTLYIAPWSNYRWVQTLTQSVLAESQFKINPREFNESIPRAVIFVQDITPGNEWKNMFVHLEGESPSDDTQIILAKSGRMNFYPEVKRATLELSEGTVYSFKPGAPEEYGVTMFASQEKEINVENLFATFSTEKRSVREKNIDELVQGIRTIERERAELLRKDEADTRRSDGVKGRSPAMEGILIQKEKSLRAHWVEVHKKFALPFVCIIFVFLGIPLGVSTKKGGRTSGFTISLGVILLYYILITAGEKIAMDGKISPFVGMWGPDFLFLAVGLWLFTKSVREAPLVPQGWSLRWKRAESREAAPDRAAARSGPRHFAPRFPNILDRYVSRKFLAVFLLIFLALLLISVIVSFFEGIDNIYEHNKSFLLLLQNIWYRTPEFVFYILPVAVLTTTLLALGLLTKSNEITAMKACGISLYRIILPVLLLGAFMSLVSFYNQERVLPFANKMAEETWNRINDQPAQSYNYLERRWILSRTRERIFHYTYFDPVPGLFSKLFIYDIDPGSWTLKRILYADRARLTKEALGLQKFWDRKITGEAISPFRKADALDLKIAEKSDDFIKEWKAPNMMNYRELRAYIAEIEGGGFETTRFRVDLNFKMSFPLVCLIMTLLGIPFAFSMGKRGALVGIGMSIAIAMVYWGAIGVFRSLGYVKILTPFLAAWAPNLMFGLMGIYLLFRLRT
jgi:LPS export ABC transporter permease LptF/LPS export ABC transporter permease LptG